MNASNLRRFALALPDASEAGHFDRAAFRTPKRIFCTLASDEKTANVKIDPDQQAALCRAHPDAFYAVEGAWGHQGWTTCVLAKVSAAQLKAVLADAHVVASVAKRTTPKARRTKR